MALITLYQRVNPYSLLNSCRYNAADIWLQVKLITTYERQIAHVMRISIKYAYNIIEFPLQYLTGFLVPFKVHYYRFMRKVSRGGGATLS